MAPEASKPGSNPGDRPDGNPRRRIRRPPSERNSFTADVASILVGENEVPFIVHNNQLRESSEFFKGLLRSGGNFKENREGTIKLPECSAESFSLYVEYVYTGWLSTKATSGAAAHEEWTALCDLIILADYLQADDLHNSVIGAFFDCMTEYKDERPSIDIVVKAYENLPADSPFILMLKDIYVHLNLEAQRMQQSIKQTNLESYV
ncbi:hypothetical protein BT63DRAFT_415592 [Microthyrium microscopicum]|uniref:BTB domain-containing protein n=1 Tax=Microthyrium microscopicum TaxID=703497 RepID=A0A6A6U913_9PEZI|nr:hypothetical protein BT63DRAFT_415592 [Microthyrium microscopicum]